MIHISKRYTFSITYRPRICWQIERSETPEAVQALFQAAEDQKEAEEKQNKNKQRQHQKAIVNILL